MTRRPELDGLRGLAIALVVLEHSTSGVDPLFRPLMPGLPLAHGGGGFIGVNLFFVLSGFLITSIILAELEGTGRIRLRAFYARRVRRLMPALLMVCAVFAAFALTLSGSARTQAAGSLARALTYTTDLDFLLRRHLANGPWLAHTWSLAVEEQFYILWPLTLIVAHRLGGRRAILAACALGIVLTVVLRFTLEARGVRTYSIMRWDAPLVGCILAVRPVRVPRVVGVTAVAVLTFYVIHLPAPLRPVDYTVATLACGAVMTHAGGIRVLRSRALRHLGQISYGLYLWHFVLLQFGLPTVLAVSLAVVAAELSYRFVERPILSRGPRSAERRVVGPPGLTAMPEPTGQP
jgi:peptidoglycan/LPS O-acetylase OafA/YrhL